MSRRELGELEKRWNTWNGEAWQGERDIKKMHAEVECLRKKAVGMGWSTEKEQAQAGEEVIRRAKDDAMRCTQVGVNLLFTRRFLVNN